MSELPDLPQGDDGDWSVPPQIQVVKWLGTYSRALEDARKAAASVAEEYAEAKKAYRRAYAEAYLSATGPIKEREQRAVLEAEDAQFHLDVTEQRLRAAREHIDTLKTQISAGQTIHKGILAELSTAGLEGP